LPADNMSSMSKELQVFAANSERQHNQGELWTQYRTGQVVLEMALSYTVFSKIARQVGINKQ
jgi:hypothetical protein